MIRFQSFWFFSHSLIQLVPSFSLAFQAIRLLCTSCHCSNSNVNVNATESVRSRNNKEWCSVIWLFAPSAFSTWDDVRVCLFIDFRHNFRLIHWTIFGWFKGRLCTHMRTHTLTHSRSLPEEGKKIGKWNEFGEWDSFKAISVLLNKLMSFVKFLIVLNQYIWDMLLCVGTTCESPITFASSSTFRCCCYCLSSKLLFFLWHCFGGGRFLLRQTFARDHDQQYFIIWFDYTWLGSSFSPFAICFAPFNSVIYLFSSCVCSRAFLHFTFVFA